MANRLKPTYKIFVIDDDKFDELDKDLPYMTKAKLKDSLGFANPKTNEAYVRRTGVKDIDDSTMQHELMELLVKVSPDEVDGIRYKKGGVMKSIAPILVGALAAPFTGGASLIPVLLGAATGAGMNAYAASKHPEQLGSPLKAGLLGGVTGALGGYGGSALTTGAMAGAKQAAPGFLSKLGGAAKGSMVGTPAKIGTSVGGTGVGSAPAGVSTFTPATKGLLGAGGALLGSGTQASLEAGKQWAGTIPSSTPGMSVLPGISPSAVPSPGAMNLNEPAMSLPSGGVGNVLGQPVSPAITPPSPITPALPITPGAAVTTTPSVAPPETSSLVQKLGTMVKDPMTLLGTGFLGASMLPKTSEFKMPDDFTTLQSKLFEGGGLSPLGQQAQAELSNILKSKPEELYAPAKDAYYQAVLRRTEQAYELAQQQLDAQYNFAGVYGSGEHLAAKDKLNQQLINAKTDLFAQTEQRNFELARSEKYAAIQQSLGVDKDVMDDLIGLTGLSVQSAANAYNVKAADVEELRRALGTIGSEALIKGMGIQRQPTINLSMGG